jgi:hypothetical protein
MIVPSGMYCGVNSMCAMATRVAAKPEAQIKIAYEE